MAGVPGKAARGRYNPRMTATETVVSAMGDPRQVTADAAPEHRGDTDPPPGDSAAFPLRRDVLPMASLAVVTFSVYVWTLLPGVGYSGDTAKWQFLGRVGGIPHPTGYPLYLLLNKVFVWAVPLKSLAWRANLLSAVCATAAVVLLYRLMQTLGVRRPVAAPVALVFAFTLTFWSQALVAEVYTLHVLLMVATLACFARWKMGGANCWLLAGTAVYAVSFGNHLSSMFLLPGIMWMVWTDRRRALTWANAAWTLGWILLGASLYLLVWAARTGAYVEVGMNSWDDFAWYVGGGYFREKMFAFGPAELVTTRVPMLAHMLVAEFGILCLPSVYGAWRLASQRGPRRSMCLALLLYAGLATVYGLGYDIDDVFVYFIPLYLVIAIFLGVGVDGLLRHAGATELRWLPTLALVGTLPLLLLGTNWARVNLRSFVDDESRIDAILERVDDASVVVTSEYPTYEYLQERLLGEGIGERRKLAAVHTTAADLVAYLESRPSKIDSVAGPGGRVYAVDDELREDLAGMAVRVDDLGDGVALVGAR